MECITATEGHYQTLQSLLERIKFCLRCLYWPGTMAVGWLVDYLFFHLCKLYELCTLCGLNVALFYLSEIGRWERLAGIESQNSQEFLLGSLEISPLKRLLA